MVFANWLRGFGLITIIDHGDGYMTLYGHSSSLFTSPGDWVEAGETMATIEAMKMEAAITVPVDGVVERLAVAATAQVDAGDLLVVITPAG